PNNGNGNVRINGTTTLGGLTYTWPGSIASNNYILQAQTNGTLAWIDPGSLPSSNFFDQINGVLTPKIETQDFLLGGQSTGSAKFAFINNNGGTPTASIAGTANNALSLDGNGTIGTTNKQTLTLGNAGTGDINFVIGGSNNLRINGTAGVNVSGSCVNTINGIVTSAATCQSGLEPWQTANGTLYTGNTTLDLLVGGIATSSAKFAVLNVNNGTPVASVGGTTGGLSFAANGTIQTTNNQPITLSAPNIVLSGLATGIVHSTNGLLSSSAVDLASPDVTGVLTLNKGGTNANLTAANGGIVYSDASGFAILTPTAVAGQALVSGANSAPSWFTPTQGSLIFAGASGVLSQDNANFF